MKTFQTIEEILDFAMKAEQEAVDFYLDLAQLQKNRQIAEVFLEFAKEEVKHKARLRKIKEEKVFQFDREKITDLKIADYVVSSKPGSSMDYADALVLAMKKEKAAYTLYMALAQRTTDPLLVKAFHALAQEESKHKLRFEMEYDEYVMREN